MGLHSMDLYQKVAKDAWNVVGWEMRRWEPSPAAISRRKASGEGREAMVWMPCVSKLWGGLFGCR